MDGAGVFFMAEFRQLGLRSLSRELGTRSSRILISAAISFFQSLSTWGLQILPPSGTLVLLSPNGFAPLLRSRSRPAAPSAVFPRHLRNLPPQAPA